VKNRSIKFRKTKKLIGAPSYLMKHLGQIPWVKPKAEGKALHDHLYSDVGRDVIATVYFFANSEFSLLKYVL
jgi:hypothetical protein